jgi:hypothetical protein
MILKWVLDRGPVRLKLKVSGPSPERRATGKRWLVSMRKLGHPTDFAALVAGVYAALSLISTTTAGNAAATMITLGVITAAVALYALARPDKVASEGLIALMGLLIVLSPWVMGFSDARAISVTA